MAMSAWTRKGQKERQVFLGYTQDQSALTIRIATEDEIENQPNRCFKPSTETSELWLTIFGRKLPLARANAMLTGKEINSETGNAKSLEPAVTINRLNKEKTKIVKAPFAFSVEQIAEMTATPANLVILTNSFGGPLLIAGQIPYEQKKKAKKTTDQPEIARVRLEREAEEGETEIVRVRGK